MQDLVKLELTSRYKDARGIVDAKTGTKIIFMPLCTILPNFGSFQHVLGFWCSWPIYNVSKAM
jgi:hypothetical protein